jgi:hypothetical protein
MHDRSAHLTIVDLLRIRPVDFALVDSVWAMEGYGPLHGTPVRLDTVLAGANAIAVDRVGAASIEVAQRLPRYLDYAAAAGLGPADLNEIDVAGDALAPRPIQQPLYPPFVEYPRTFPSTFDPSAGQKAFVGVWYAGTCSRTLRVLRLSEETATAEVVRELAPPGTRGTGHEYVAWDGRADDGTLAPPGRYAAHVRARHTTGAGRPIDGVGWFTVAAR